MNRFSQGEGRGGAPEIGGFCPAVYVAVKGAVTCEGMPDVIELKGGIPVNTPVAAVAEVVLDPAAVAVGDTEDWRFCSIRAW